MNKIRVIDLLNKIANGEEVPRKIEYDSIIYTRGWSDYMGDEPITEYYNHDIYGSWFNGTELTLDKEVEIIEEDKEIELIPIEDFNISYNLEFIDYKNIEVLKNYLNKDFQTIFDTLDLLISNQKKLEKAVNELKKGK